MSSWHSYPQIFNLGHRAVSDLLNHDCYVEEKVDGSQVSFGKFEVRDEYTNDWTGAYELRIRSKGCVMMIDAPEKMFTLAAETVKRLEPLLVPGWTYRGEFLAKPKHNTLAYDRAPAGNIILFDVSTGDNEWLGPPEKVTEAAWLGLECVPKLLHNLFNPISYDDLRELLDSQQSVLGGQLIEGVVIKPFPADPVYGPDKKTLMGKFVSERFKEAHKEEWKKTSPQSGDIIDSLVKTFKVEGRWLKAIQHLREAGALQDAPQDIPALIKEIQADIEKEEKEEITAILWKWAWNSVSRAVTKGFPEFYKDYLLKRQFETMELGTEEDRG